MFCPDCGNKVDSKFCPNCGKELDAKSAISNAPQEINMDEIKEIFRGNKIEMIKYVKSTAGISLPEAKTLVDNYFVSDNSAQKTFWASSIEQGNAINAKKALEKQQAKEHINQMDKDGIAYCPKCYSSSLSANKKGFGIGKAIVGSVLTMNPLGLVAGNLGAKKVRVTCMKCGHQFFAGKK